MGWLQTPRQDHIDPDTLSAFNQMMETVTISNDTKSQSRIEHAEYAGIVPDSISDERRSLKMEPTKTEPYHYTPTAQLSKYPFRDEDTPDSDFPCIPAAEVIAKARPGALSVHKMNRPRQKLHDYWIVIDNMVFDCSSFVEDHPGGEQVILSFLGQDCSWQFWRFHSPEHMRVYGRPLRIGRTEGVKNQFVEQPRFVGLRRLGHDEW